MSTGEKKRLEFGTTTDWGFGGGIWSDRAAIVKLNIALFIVLLFTHVFDVWSTIIILANGGEEMNPLALWFMSLLGTYAGLLVLKSYTVLLSGILVRTWIDSPVVACALVLVTVIMMNVLLITHIPLLCFIYGGA